MPCPLAEQHLLLSFLTPLRRLGRSPFSTKQRKQAAEAADAEAEGREESEGPRLLLSGRSLPARRGRGKRKKSKVTFCCTAGRLHLLIAVLGAGLRVFAASTLGDAGQGSCGLSKALTPLPAK